MHEVIQSQLYFSLHTYVDSHYCKHVAAFLTCTQYAALQECTGTFYDIQAAQKLL